jgi:hypothetical protein
MTKIYTTSSRRPRMNRTYACLQLSFRVVDGPCYNIFPPTLNEHQGQWYTQNHISKICLLRLMYNFLLLFHYNALHKHLQNDVLTSTRNHFTGVFWVMTPCSLVCDFRRFEWPAAWYVSRPVYRLTPCSLVCDLRRFEWPVAWYVSRPVRRRTQFFVFLFISPRQMPG